MKKIGLIINPIAGIGGSVGLKGSDGADIQRLALERGAVKRSGTRAAALAQLASCSGDILLLCGPGEMGEAAAAEAGLSCEVIHQGGSAAGCNAFAKAETTAEDTVGLAARMREEGAELILFAGGDGTARDVLRAVGDAVPVIGIPAGVKIHSGVFATSPAEAGKLAEAFANASRVPERMAEVIDLNEEEYRKGVIGDTLYGYMKVLVLGTGFQNPKAASHNSDNDVGGICQEIRDKMAAEPADTVFILGAGSTLHSVKKALGIDGSLLGIDAVCGGKLIGKDLPADGLREIVSAHDCRLILTVIGGQGHIFGRGNQQLMPDIIRSIGTENIWIVAAASKIYGLPGQSLFVDTSDADLDEELRGYRRVIVGWQDTLICQVK